MDRSRQREQSKSKPTSPWANEVEDAKGPTIKFSASKRPFSKTLAVPPLVIFFCENSATQGAFVPRPSIERERERVRMVSGSGLCAKRVVVDGRHHMLGRLASVLAKELLNGQRVVVVRCDEICLSGGLVRQKMKYMRFLRKRMNTKPSHGPIHFRAPAKILWRTIRGMIPHKTKRGAAALARLKTFEGVPPPYDKVKRMVIPDALKVLRLQSGHKYCLLGRLSSEVGWNHYETIKELERKRKEKSQLVYERKKQLTKLRVKAEKAAEEKLGAQMEVIAPIKY
ncbi:uncharacterized protein J3R85_020268 [Psidium guajava]|nr:uncharacterized protein J3R85_020268 [Psidium guajava]